jgi:DNA-binding transcriptional MocR family regulator
VSAEAMKWAKRQPITGSPKAVLLALAWYANKTGVGWPSQQTLADYTGLGVRTVRRALVTLEDRNVIRRRPRSRGALGRSSDHIELPIWREVAPLKRTIRPLLPTGQSGRLRGKNEPYSQPANLTVPTGQSGRGIVSDQQSPDQERFSIEELGTTRGTDWPPLRVIAGGLK